MAEARGWRELTEEYWTTFSFVGLVIGTLLFAGSLTPTLLPRHYAVQGVLSGLAFAVGYAIGVTGVLVWLFLEIPEPTGRVQRWSKWICSGLVALVAILFLWWDKVWQDSIRERMAMPPAEAAYPLRVAVIAIVTAVILISIARGLRWLWHVVDRQIKRLVPRRVSYVLSFSLVTVLVLLLVNNVLGKLVLDAADATFLQLDQVVDEGIEQPSDANASGSSASLIEWETIGRQGKRFIARGPTAAGIGEFWGSEVKSPLRVYVGMASRETMEERAQLALAEMQRVGAFQRSVLVVATPTGTGWLDEGAVDSIEYLHRGDTAIVSMQYSYLPSWITILIDPQRSRHSAQALFDVVYDHWTTLPHDKRPKLYLHGLSLGSLGSESSADIFTIFEDPIQGAVWSGPPFPSPRWADAVRTRNPDSPMWLPKVGKGTMLRFTARENALALPGAKWGSMRYVYIQHASDPMTFFSPHLLYRRPAWLVGERGPDISPYFRWYPVVTFLQTGFDIPMATSVPTGYGHNFAPDSYIDAWVEVTAPEHWTSEDTERLKARFRQKAEATGIAGSGS